MGSECCSRRSILASQHSQNLERQMVKLATRAIIAIAAASMLGGAFPGNSVAVPEPRDPTEIWPEDVSINLNALPCVGGGPTATDAANASTLNPQLHNKMRGFMTPYNSSCAR